MGQSLSRSVLLDTIPPTIKITSPQNGALVYDSITTITGTINDETSVMLFANGMAAINGSNGAFSVQVPLVKGKNTITIEATDLAGNTTDSVQYITFMPLPPDPVKVAPTVDKTTVTTLTSATQFLYTGSNPIQTGVDTTMLNPVRLAVVRGKVLSRDLNPLPGVTIAILDHRELGQTLTRKDGMYDMVVNGGGQLTVTYAKDNYLSVQRQINAAWQKHTIMNDVVMNMFDPQVTKVIFSDTTTTVARGSVVTDQDGTRQATLIIKAGTHASIKTIHYSFEQTSIGSGKQLMKVPTDTVLQEMDTLSIRATEYTVGSSGVKSMPAPLPASSFYTYAAEFSADEAVAAGATTVEFDKPVPFYLENFLKFPVGTIVPAGYYDKDRGCWIATDNGLVIQIVNTNNGVAAIDLDGDGNPEDSTTLAAIGIDSIEQTKLASLYNSGQTLWRVPMNHFTPDDYNENGTTVGAGTANTANISQSNQDPSKNVVPGCGSIIGIQNQTLGESMPITGTPYTLFYNTERTPAYKQDYSLTLPLTGDTLPDGITGVEMDVQIAGRDFDTTFSPQPDLIKKFQWDGKDAYGRNLQGMQPVDVHIGYAYKAVYLSPPQHLDHPTFGQPGELPLTDERGNAMAWRTWSSSIGTNACEQTDVGGWCVNVHHSYDVNSQTLYYGNGTKRSAKVIGAVIYPIDGTEGLGWINIAVGPDGTLYYTRHYDVSQVWKKSPDGTISLVAGAGDRGYSGDGGAATEALLNWPQGLAIGHDGTLYISDRYNNIIRRVTPDGIISTFAGNGESAYSGDGGLAINAALNYPCDLSIGPDGTLYIADNGNSCIRAVNTAGMITTFAGTGVSGFSGDGRKADSAMLSYPIGVAVDVDGIVYIADSWNSRVRKVTPDGIITTFAGIGNPNNSWQSTGDGGLAINAQLCDPVSVAVSSDGAVYIAEGERVRAVGKEGIISTIAGGYPPYNIIGEIASGELATHTYVNPQDVAVGHNGAIYVSELPFIGYSYNSSKTNRLLATTMLQNYEDAFISVITPAFQGLGVSKDNIIIASEYGRETYVFDPNGKHLKTVDSYTGVTLFTFGYDSTGLLKSITDRNNLKTFIKRDASGNPKAIISPYRQRTLLSVDTTGYLSAIIDPANDTTRFAYSTDGLMKSMTDAKGNVHSFTYDTLGRLIEDEDPAGGFKSLTRTDNTNGYSVKVATALGDASIYSVSQDPIGQQTFTTIDAQGLTTSTKFDSDGSIVTNMPDGTITQVLQAPDPRFGMQSPLTTMTVTTPSGLSSTTTQTRTISQLQGNTVVGLTDALNINGNTYTQVFDGIQQMFAFTTPEGRQSYSFLDTLGRVIQDSVPGVLSTNYVYDMKGRVTTVTQGDRMSSFIYDSLGRIASSMDPTQDISSFAYDSINRLTRQILPDENQILYRYDATSNLLETQSRTTLFFRA